MTLLIRSFKQVAVDQSSEENRTINVKEYVDEIILSKRPRLKNSRIEVVNDYVQDLVESTLPDVILQMLSLGGNVKPKSIRYFVQ
jgi:hypothetical protein